MKMKERVILASSSPRRKELLKLVGIEPEIIAPRADEKRRQDESVEAFLKRVTLAKGDSVYRHDFYEAVLISSDTIVLLADRVIGKPETKAEARAIMEALADNVHEVWTGVGLFFQGEKYYDYARTRVCFGPIARPELDFYMENEDYMDKAGAYAIQGKASVFIERIDGCFFNVMGFPLNLFFNMLKKIGLNIYS
jgi:septum formation protein